MKKSLKWAPSVPVRRPDNLLSSQARSRGDFGFKPSYANEKRENMNHIMSNEYMKKWFNERDYYQRELFIKLQTQMEEKNIRRRYVQRMLTREKKEKVMPIIQLRRFQNIGPRSDTRRDDATKQEEKDEKKVEDTQKSKSKEEKQRTNKELKRLQSKKDTEIRPYQRYKPECNVPPTIRKKNQSNGNGQTVEPIVKPTPKLGSDNVGTGKNGLNEEKSAKGSDQANEKRVNIMVMRPCHCHCRCCKNGLDD